MRMKRMMRGVLPVAFCLGVCASLMSSSCSKNLDHCWWRNGDATCADIFNGTRPYCTSDARPCLATPTPYGCTDEEPVPECHSPCGGGKTKPECEEAGVTSGGSETDTGAAFFEDMPDLAQP